MSLSVHDITTPLTTEWGEAFQQHPPPTFITIFLSPSTLSCLNFRLGKVFLELEIIEDILCGLDMGDLVMRLIYQHTEISMYVDVHPLIYAECILISDKARLVHHPSLELCDHA